MTYFRATVGMIDYLAADGTVRGTETFLVTRNRSTITLNAEVAIHDLGVSRSVCYEVGSKFEPVRCFVAVRKGERTYDPAIFVFGDGKASLTRGGEVPSGELTDARDLPFFGAHPIAMDGWLCARALLKLGSSTGDLDLKGGLTSSLEHDGASDPGLYRVDLHATACGMQKVTVPAGEFNCQRVEMLFGAEFGVVPPPYVIWTMGDDQILVRAEHPSTGRAYVLTSLTNIT